MPELPEIETLLRGLKAEKIIGASIVDVRIFCQRLEQKEDKNLETTLVGAQITALSRRGKYLILHLSKQKLLAIHLRMSGRILLQKAGAYQDRYDRAIITLSTGIQLHFHDVRRFGTLSIIQDEKSFFSKLGMEPLSEQCTQEAFERGLQSSSMIKCLLLKQQFLAGIGNIYADEALFQAKVHPMRKASSLTKPERLNLFQAIQEVLKKGIEHNGTSLGSGRLNFHSVNGKTGKNQQTLLVYGKKGLPCARCQHPIERVRVQQRSSHFCPVCQRL